MDKKQPAASYRFERARVAAFMALALVLALDCNSRTERQTAAPVAAVGAQTLGTVPANFAESVQASLEGTRAPDVTLTLQDGFRLPLLSEKGKFVFVYFCSPEASPECMREASALRDRWQELHRLHVVVVGVSARDAAAHRAFITELRLPFDLASDADGRIAQAFNVPTFGEYGPRPFLISRDGKVLKAWQTASSEAQIQDVVAIASE